MASRTHVVCATKAERQAQLLSRMPCHQDAQQTIYTEKQLHLKLSNAAEIGINSSNAELGFLDFNED